MNVLVTAGNTFVPIDRVRGITNVFTGRTGARLAATAHARGHTVVLLTSHPETAAPPDSPDNRWHVVSYRSFDDLDALLGRLIPNGDFQALVHSAAVSDYLCTGVFAPAPGTTFDPEAAAWVAENGPPTLTDRTAGKVKSDEPELWLRLTRAPKLIDRVRADWGFRGVLVKFKLESELSQKELLAVAERSRRQSGADLMVANTVEGMAEWACVGPLDGFYERVERKDLDAALWGAVERLHERRSRG